MSAQSEDPIRLLTEVPVSLYQLEGENKNATDRSVVFAPFNTALNSEEASESHKNKKQHLEIGGLTLLGHARDANRQYELTNQHGAGVAGQRQQPLQQLLSPQPPRQSGPKVSLATDISEERQ